LGSFEIVKLNYFFEHEEILIFYKKHSADNTPKLKKIRYLGLIIEGENISSLFQVYFF